MKRLVFFIVVAVIILYLLINQYTNVLRRDSVSSAFEPLNCPVADRVFEPGAYTGPMIDAHVHIAPIPDGPTIGLGESNERPTLGVNVSIEDYICMLDVEGTKKALAFFAVWEPNTRPMLDVVKETMEKYPDRFIPFIMPPDHDDSPTGFPTVDAKTLAEMLNVYPGLFRGYGEIGLYERQGNGAPELPPNSSRLVEIYPILRKHRLLVYFHLGQGHKDEFEHVLEENPDITFIFHGDQLIEDAGGGDHLELIDEILTNHPNARYGIDELYGDVFLMRPEVSKEEFLAHFENPEPLLEKDLNTWKAFIERHPNQVMWDTDRGWSAPWSLDPEVALTLNNYSRVFIGKLDPDVQEKYAYKNAEALIEP